MNLINAAATFVGEAQTETGVRCMEMKIPVQGSKAVEVPVFLIPTRSSGETFVPEAYEKGCTILFTGRLYPCKSDNRMYVAPTQPLQTVPNNTVLNQVSLAGGVGFIAEERREDLFNCGLLCQAPPQKLIGHTWDDSLPFRLEAWGDDAARMRKFLYKGRQIALTASLRFETWNSKDGPGLHTKSAFAPVCTLSLERTRPTRIPFRSSSKILLNLMRNQRWQPSSPNP